VKVDNQGLVLPAGLVSSDDPQRMVDEARKAADCSKGNAVLMREGLTSSGQRLSLSLRCRSDPTPRWQAPVQISDLEVDPGLVWDVQETESPALAKLYEWLKVQKLQPPASRPDTLAVEMRDILAGDKPLKPIGRR
jgi:hypothetical protein